jgi:hypothetical protein
MEDIRVQIEIAKKREAESPVVVNTAIEPPSTKTTEINDITNLVRSKKTLEAEKKRKVDEVNAESEAKKVKNDE